MASPYKLLNCKPVPAKLYDELVALGFGKDITLTSCLRTQAAVNYARSKNCRLSSQAELYDGWVNRRPGYNPANPPGQSTHEQRSDGVAYAGPRGRPLPYWAVGIDCVLPGGGSAVSTIRARAAKRHWVFTLTYTDGREAHHGNFRKEPILATYRPLKKGSRGPRVATLTARLAYLGDLPGVSPRVGTMGFGYKVEAAVKLFQKHWHLKQDGVVGPQTQAQLLVAVRKRKDARAKAARERAAAKAPATKSVARVSEKGTAFIAEFEGGQSPDGLFRPYWDAIGRVWTIGYGHTENVNAKSKPLSKAQALELLRTDLNDTYAPPVLKLNLGLNQYQLDAIVSAAYNLGPGVLDRGRSLGDALRAKNFAAVPKALALYDKGGSPLKAVPGLTRRRKAEGNLFARGSYDTTP